MLVILFLILCFLRCPPVSSFRALVNWVVSALRVICLKSEFEAVEEVQAGRQGTSPVEQSGRAVDRVVALRETNERGRVALLQYLSLTI